MTRPFFILSAAIMLSGSAWAQVESDQLLAFDLKSEIESIKAEDEDPFRALTDEDYAVVAQELGVNKACIKAVVEIETGNKGEGFGPDNLPIINFDLTMFKKYARQRGINVEAAQRQHPAVFVRPNVADYGGSVQRARYARLKEAMEIDSVAALEGTFWGMFQIGGFNWRQCGCESVYQFVELMSQSELSQLELFATFVNNRGLTKYLQRRDWASFALRYNGPNYKKRAYDTRMAQAYRRYNQ